MKKHFLIYKLLLVLIITGCNDEIEDIQPFTQGNPSTFFKDIQSFQNGVDGAYNKLRSYYQDPARGLQGIPDILSDNVVLAQTGRRSNEVFYDYRYNPNTELASSWIFNQGYEAVGAANLVIGQIDNLPDGDEKRNIHGQALAARALAHFDIVRLHAKIPTQSADANSSLGIPYIKVEDGDTGNPLATPARETVASNYQEIIEDLEKAASLISSETVEGRLNKNSVYGLLSKVYLYNGDYQLAINAADKVTTPLATAAELEDVYTDVSNAGLVIEFAINTTSETRNNNVGVLYSQTNSEGTKSEYVIDFDFFQSIDDNDARKSVMVFEADFADNKYNAVKKFLGEKGEVNGRVDIKVMRAAEVLLNKAEAQFELGNNAEALATLDELRAARDGGTGSGSETGQALEDAIQLNRRIELAFEGHRFFDIKRRGESINRSSKGDLIDGTGTPAEILTLAAGDNRFQFPIPADEVNANPNFKQNPGY
ncbi:RagB/SusD family nutrient uptake outer membrane protein [Aquimarina sp. TRL1]|uniref:RagB/SusD family nutrient uptake outer membrane protein n=1 Tax=Aquimarina sp. (strain TRL1) TaxID=2736252 RepID=UPI00158ACFE9|nr:RagB/SusD family nutrient uptake outer membrane protein [Aquimarina sp. TRL1]QKX03758.1 RagB/SusD family nutrient uptake outer membrane protein [Aquimarina sp. TRL1]